MEFRRFGLWALGEVPFIWIATEFFRYWITGNNWNAIGFAMAFDSFGNQFASFGGIYSVGFFVASLNTGVLGAFLALKEGQTPKKYYPLVFVPLYGLLFLSHFQFGNPSEGSLALNSPTAKVVAVQPDVPMAGLDEDKWRQLRQHQIEQAESALKKLPTDNRPMTTVVLPESPMNFMWGEDLEFQDFIKQFAAKNNVTVLFNSAEPDRENHKYFNSAVMISPEGRELAEYDKIYLLPFGEAVPVPLESLVPGFVGNFSYGKNYDLVPLGDAKAGIMICFESHFGQLSREYVCRGADAIIEMTNDGYLGPTPVL